MRIDKRLYVGGNESGDSSNLDVRDLAIRRLVSPNADAQGPSCLSIVPQTALLCGAAKLCMNIRHTSCTGVNSERAPPKTTGRKTPTKSGCLLALHQI
jgi:hypothetical protein